MPDSFVSCLRPILRAAFPSRRVSGLKADSIERDLQKKGTTLDPLPFNPLLPALLSSLSRGRALLGEREPPGEVRDKQGYREEEGVVAATEKSERKSAVYSAPIKRDTRGETIARTSVAKERPTWCPAHSSW